jgi:hypothetical protein
MRSDMAITIQRLHPVQWDILSGIDDGYSPDPSETKAIVARNGTHVLARLFAMRPWHVEGIFVEPEYRGGTLFKDMMSAMEVELKSEGVKLALAYSVRPEIGHYIQRNCHYKLQPWQVYMKELV